MTCLFFFEKSLPASLGLKLADVLDDREVVYNSESSSSQAVDRLNVRLYAVFFSADPLSSYYLGSDAHVEGGSSLKKVQLSFGICAYGGNESYMKVLASKQTWHIGNVCTTTPGF